MFDNVPEQLTREVRHRAFGVVGRRAVDALILDTAVAVIKYYLGPRWLEPLVREAIADENIIGHDLVHAKYPLYLICIGEALFLLRSTPAFPEFCRRLKVKVRDLRSVFFEMLMTRRYLEARCEIFAREETKIRGLDFDFEVMRGTDRINVEVTALEERPFAETTLANALHHKRTQLPTTAPAIIHVVLPDCWDAEDLERHVGETVSRFFRGTRRINAVFVHLEKQIPDADTPANGAYALSVQPYFNATARLPVANLLDFVPPAGQFSETATNVLNRRVPFEMGSLSESDRAIARSGEFFRWIEHLRNQSGFIP